MVAESLVVGIAGGTGSGKSTLARRLRWEVGEDRCSVVTQDNYYQDLTELTYEARSRVNFDHPNAIDSALLAEHLQELRAGRSIAMPTYDFSRHVRRQQTVSVEPRPVVLVEGILVFVWPDVAAQVDVKIFVDAADDVRLLRRVRRDIADRGRDLDSVLDQYQSTVRPMHEEYVAPSRAAADLIVAGHGYNDVVVKLLARALRDGVPLS